MEKNWKAVVLAAGLMLALGPGWAFGLDSTGNDRLAAVDGITIDGEGSDGSDLDSSHFTGLNVKSGHLFSNSDITLSGTGSLTVSDTSTTSGMSTWNTDSPETDSEHVYDLTVSGGTLTVGNATKGGYLETGAFKMTDGTVNVAGDLGKNDTWVDGSFITGGFGSTVAVDLTGGTLNLGTGGRIQSTREQSPTGQSQIFHIGGDVVINMAEGSMIRALGGYLQDAPDNNSNGYYTKLVMDGGTINVDGNAVLLSRETEMNGGKIEVDSGKKLTVAGTATDDGTIADNITDVDAESWGDFNINGGTEIVATGAIDLATGEMDLNASGGKLTGNLDLQSGVDGSMSSGIYANNLHVVSGGAFEVNGDFNVAAGYELDNKGTLEITGATVADSVALDLASGNTIFGGTVTASTGGVNVGTAGSTASATFGDNITGDVNVDDGSSMIVDGTVTASSNVTLNENSALTINNGASLAVTSNLEVKESTVLTVNGNTDATGALDVGTMSVGGSNAAADIGNYLASQNSSGIASGKEYTWDDANKKITYATTAAANSTEGMTNALNKTGNGHLMPGLTASATDTWADIITGATLTPSTPQGVATKGLMDTYLNTVNATTSAAEQQSVVSALAGLDSAKSLDIAMLTANNVAGRIQSRVADNNLARASADSRFGSGSALASYALNSSFANRFWFGGFGLWEDADRRGFDNGYEYKSGGFITGYDRVFGAVTVGGSFAYTAGSYEDKNALASDSDIDSYAFTLYGTYNHCSGFFGTLMAGYTYSDYDMNNFVAGNQWNKADFHANTWTIGGTLGYDFRPTECLTITPSIGLYHYTSASSTFRTTLQNSMKVEQDATELPIDVAVNYDIPTASGKVRLTANTGYAYSFSKDGGELDGFGYNGIANARVEGIKGRENARHTWNIGAGATYSTGRFDVGVKYDYYLKSDYDAHRVMGTVGINF